MLPEISTREAYGRALLAVGETHPEIVVLDADLSKSTMTKYFAERFPERFFQMGIQEQNMIDVAAGLATCGKKPFVSTFAIFGSRGWEQIRNTCCRAALPVAFCFSHTGLAVGEDGASAQALEDIAIMRVLPNMKVIVPADAPETEKIILFLADNLQKLGGPVYVRLTRQKLQIIHSSTYEFRLGKGEILAVGNDIAYIACGSCVSIALLAREELMKIGIRAAVVNMSTIKPIDLKLIHDVAKKTGKIITIEDHSIIGGLGEAVASSLSEIYPVPLKRIGVEDVFGESGSAEELYEKYGLSVSQVVKKTKIFLQEH